MVASVAFPIAVPGVYDYLIPEHLVQETVPGMPVRVDFNGRPLWGVVVRVVAQSSFPRLKEILEIKSGSWSDASRSLLRLYEWIAQYYQCDLGKVFKPMVSKSVLNSSEKSVMRYSFSGTIPAELTRGQQATARKLEGLSEWLTREELQQRFALSEYMIGQLLQKGVLLGQSERIFREADELRSEVEEYRVALSEEQRQAVAAIEGALGTSAKPFLLYGITGSGKTFVYIEAARRALQKGFGVIILVPEISLTPQTIQRFRAALGDVIAVIHSRMSDGERRDSVEELVAGRKRVVIGVRSAILVPIERVGLIIVDEEHDTSYKQSDLDPRYHARNVAVMRGHFQSAAVVLGSATPSFESFHNARQGKYQLLKLASRFGAARLPAVSIVDMNAEHKENNWTFLSRYLASRIRQTLDNRRQVILLLNRRGFSAFLICKECGHIYRCPNCSVHLTFHLEGNIIRCHQCNHEERAPDSCVDCHGEQIKYRGTGIQKAEEHLVAMFPDARIMRMDQDSTRRKGSHVQIIDKVSRHEVDILLGTQMVAKGLNFPGVSLVGVLQADIGLHIPDFRAAERTYQLVSQVAGRAGREDDAGEVVVQTYVPNEPCIQASLRHDFDAFYTQEIDSRKMLNYPPFSKLARVVVAGEQEAGVADTAEAIARLIRLQADPAVTMLGPVPAMIARIKNAYRYSILLKATQVKAFGAAIAAVRRGPWSRRRDVRVIVDVDPISMM